MSSEPTANLKFVTSFSGEGFAKYGQRMVDSFRKHVPWAYLVAYVHDPLPQGLPASGANVTVIPLEGEDIASFRLQYAKLNGGDPYDFRRDALKFSWKIFAMARGAEALQEGWLIWLDGDTEFSADLPEEEFRQHLQGDFAFLGRSVVPYIESSFMCWNISSPAARGFLKDVYAAYVTGELTNYAEWHDGWVISRLLAMHLQHGLLATNLSPEPKGLDAFSTSFLGKYCTHFKGSKKDAAAGPQQERHLLWLRTPSGLFQPLKVQPKDAAPKAVISANIVKNSVDLLKVWLVRAAPHGRKGIICGSGPSLTMEFPWLREQQAKGAYIVCVKHSLPLLLAAGITPDACVILEARPLDGESTHGFIRKDLYKDVTPDTLFFVGSMSDPAVTEHIIAKGCPIIGWHAYTEAALEWARDKPHVLMIPGGTCSAIRTVGILQTLGFREVDIVGVDACITHEPTPEMRTRKDDAGRQWWLEARCWRPDARSWWTSGEMLALAQDIVQLAQVAQMGNIKINFHSNLLAGEIWGGLPRLDFLDNYAKLMDIARRISKNESIEGIL